MSKSKMKKIRAWLVRDFEGGKMGLWTGPKAKMELQRGKWFAWDRGKWIGGFVTVKTLASRFGYTGPFPLPAQYIRVTVEVPA